MDIWLIRHGETDWNVARRVQGWTDVPLNATGRRQASLLADSLEGIPFQHIYSSDLSRAHDTGIAIAKSTGTPITTTPDLREQYFGQAEGLMRHEADARFPNGAPDEETPAMVEQRIARVLRQIAKDHTQGRIVLATHGGVVRAALRWLGVEPPFIGNTSITVLRVTDGNFRVIAIAAAPHLENDAASAATGIS